jgi:hypothetical protein
VISRFQVEVGTHIKGCSGLLDWSGAVQIGEKLFSPTSAELCIHAVLHGKYIDF